MSHSSGATSVCTALDSLLTESTGGMKLTDRKTVCCCGRSQCAYLEHNNAALEGLEKDLQSAAQIGQVSPNQSNCLLVRRANPGDHDT